NAGDVIADRACHLFYFSSRRRHTRSKRDWSSDVCSSDLIKISVNLSMNQFKDEKLVDNFIEIIEDTGVSANDIGIELTESSLIADMEETIVKLYQLKHLGFYIAVDDFGTGYSSLGYLIDFP